ncbi:hypothetical protein AZ027_002059, partial [Klebsiella pneumoniae]
TIKRCYQIFILVMYGCVVICFDYSN